MQPELFATLRQEAMKKRQELFVSKQKMEVITVEEIASKLKATNMFSGKLFLKLKVIVLVIIAKRGRAAVLLGSVGTKKRKLNADAPQSN